LINNLKARIGTTFLDILPSVCLIFDFLFIHSFSLLLVLVFVIAVSHLLVSLTAFLTEWRILISIKLPVSLVSHVCYDILFAVLLAFIISPITATKIPHAIFCDSIFETFFFFLHLGWCFALFYWINLNSSARRIEYLVLKHKC
jgi:hypothetical protein